MSDKEFNFSSQYTDNFPKILQKLNISLAITSYQSTKLILIRSHQDTIETRYKAFPRPMGIYADDTRITLGTYNQVVEFKRCDKILEEIKNGKLDNTTKFAKKVLEKNKEDMENHKKEREEEIAQVKDSDALYVHRASITTGMINIHDIAWGNEGLWVVNSTFSALATLSPDSSFVARWWPEWISELVPEDRCHLNGMAMQDGKPKYVTTFNTQDTKDSWSNRNINNGTLIDIDTNTILIDGMVMPHSPKVYKNNVYVCESGYGIVWRYNPKTKEKTEVIRLQGFTRGLYFYGDIMFVCTSQLRVSDIKNPVPLNSIYEQTYSGIYMVDMDSGSVISSITFDGDVDQIYDITVIPDCTRPEILNINSSLIRHIFDFTEERM